jgi:hypothetical protein
MLGRGTASASRGPLFALSLGATLMVTAAADARFFDGMARREFARGRYDRAMESFLLSQQMAPNPRTIFNIALAAQLARQPSTALAHYIEYLATAGDDDPERREDAEAAVARLGRGAALVQITTTPPGATIYIDRSELGSVGVSPRLVPVEAGQRRIVVELTGYRRAEATVDAALGTRAELTLELEPIVGTLRVDASPAGASVVVTRRGQEVVRGVSPFEEELPVGRYRVRVEAEGHMPDATNARIVEGRHTHTRLTARSLGTRSGRLLVSTGAVLGADVRLDGRWVGRTPLTVPRALAGERAIEVRARGYRRWSGRVTVPLGDAVHLPVALERAD